MTLKAGQDVGCGDKDPSPNPPSPFAGLSIGRIVHVCLLLPTANWPLVERPAIVTEVKCHERGIIAAHIFMSPEDPPGELILHREGNTTTARTFGDGGDGRPVGSELHYLDHPRQPHEPWTWHWPEGSRR